ncbi:uncharacterized protein K452DRAFT_313285 [Aplosporella prunicola CBS 121167]|uniref:C3H1-type domain-containing protein n=1 Tax=Aplosporella prunicola CBS 121167 TaxID=1176127 RepID=A0A6A6AWI9_9PEZI|nr:uncharacterized protein K452DRAFT_313285 [Aplosporella prunicola CBS 121167]KAF2136309.1 hypothetical protein K452DRAFT_313285 [Aplosporella prunicola CBS 121167]
MHVEDADTPLLKTWIVKRLEDISDADSDVLADYVLALVKSEDPDEQVKSNSLENLEDFLHNHTASFVDDVISAVHTKSFIPGHGAPQVLQATAPPFNPPSGPANGNRRPSAQFQNGLYNGGADQSRKRTWGDRAGSEQRDGQDSHYGRGAGGERAMKQMRRGGHQGGGRGGRFGQEMNIPGLSGVGQGSMPSMQNMPPMPTPPPGFPPIDPNNPLSAMLAMQAMGGFPPMPGMPQLPMAGSPPSFGQGPSRFPQAGSPPPKRVGERCRDYDTKGFCALGSVCPYEHGDNPIIVPADGAKKSPFPDLPQPARRGTIEIANPETAEYDPKNASIDTHRNTNGHHGHERPHHERGRGGRGRGRGDGGRRGGRAAFSSAGPNHDRSITAIVVEQIPEDKFSEEAVREFFSEFGNIEEITMQAYKRLAIVKFDDYWAARRAYDSPKVIFDNRFVKVYWYKPETMGPDANGRQGSESAKKDEEMIDMAEVERKQAEAQKAHEEKQKKLKEAETQKAELAEKLKAQAEERKKLLEKLAAKTAAKGPSDAPAVDEAMTDAGEGANGTAEGEKKSALTESLKLKLAQLEAEAESMGLNPNESYGSNPYRGRGGRGARGAFRGRGAYAPRGRGFDAYRGSYRGRGGFTGAPYGGARGGAVKRLDNRPRRIVVSLPGEDGEWTTDKDEALRSYLFNNFEFESVEPHEEHKNAQIVAFKERYVAENFITQSTNIPTVGKVDLSWAPNPPLPLPSTAAPGSDAAHKAGDADVSMGDSTTAPSETKHGEAADMEYDVADDDERWMAA